METCGWPDWLRQRENAILDSSADLGPVWSGNAQRSPVGVLFAHEPTEPGGSQRRRYMSQDAAKAVACATWAGVDTAHN